MTEASNGLEAWRIYAAHPQDFHLVLTDVVMPDLGGVELVNRIRQENPVQKVLLATGFADDALSVLAEAQHPPTVLQKPLVPTTLLKTVRDVLDDRSSVQPEHSQG